MRKKLQNVVDGTLLRFLIVGVINTIFGTSVMFAAYNLLGFGYWVSSALNYIFGGILSYFLNKYFTFKSSAGGVRTMIKFAANVFVCYMLAYGIAKPAVLMLLDGVSTKIQENAAMFVGMCLYTGLNYLGQRFFAFKE